MTAPLRPMLLAAVLLLDACAGVGTTTMQFYPISGEIAAQDPTLVLQATMRNVDSTSGPLALRLPGGVNCEGTWTSLTPKTVSRTRGLSLTWRRTGGEIGDETTTVARVNDGELYAVCDDGRRVLGNFVIGSGTASGTGSASDTAGNVYKLLF